MKRRTPQQAPEIEVRTRGQMPPGTEDYALDKVGALFDRTREPVLFARVRLTHQADPAVDRPVIAQANLDVNGRPVRAHVAAATVTEAVDVLRDRLAARLESLAEHDEARRERGPGGGPHEWRHGDEPARRPDWFPRPPEERRVVRHKSFSLARETPDEAAFEMELMDYGFHLFTDLDTGEDSVLYRSGPTGYRLARTHPGEESVSGTAVPITVSDLPAPRMTVAQAKRRLDLTGYPFVFFAEDTTGRGNVLYHRYDGHYGLITPAD
ncbi:sigma 54 modulation/S30EA ribosomal C-terminal domain-containing protein [Streptomyces sp. HPF1205]|uniref:ribosome hibernation promotion factor n=1 Tax=Streptomyces sp. HPF1205 TaxID=2873262 RepID=UPI001CED5D8E|nr:sigma 54 modulation/S30EA ribosomal C-terminal domain-containing protein [Streptomyces sp. HPF1205]